MPARPCTPETGAPTDLGTPIDGPGHQFRRGVDQPDYVRLLRQIASFDHAALQTAVTRRAMFYGFHPQQVSSQPSETKAVEPIPAHLGSFRGPRPSPGIPFRSLHAWTLKSRPQASQPMADCAQSENVSGCPVAPSIHGTPPPAARKNTPVGAAAELPRGVAGVRLAVAVHPSMNLFRSS